MFVDDPHRRRDRAEAFDGRGATAVANPVGQHIDTAHERRAVWWQLVPDGRADLPAVGQDLFERQAGAAERADARGCPGDGRDASAAQQADTDQSSGSRQRHGYFLPLSPAASVDSAATKASCGTSTRPMVFIRFLPSFCFSSSLRLRVMSPP